MAVTIFIEWFLEESLRKSQIQKIQLDTSKDANHIASKLTGMINNNLSLINGLSAHIASYSEIKQPDFETYVKEVFQNQPLLINMAAAPDLVIRMIYPLEGNRGALGLNYRKNDDQWDAVKQAIINRKMIVAGPVELVQGGTAIIGRTGVFTPSGDLWGLVSAPIDANLLYEKAGLLDPRLKMDISIRGKDGLGASGDVFFGDPSIFEQTNTITTVISVGEGSWLLAAQPKAGLITTPNEIWILRISCLLLLPVIAVFAYYRVQNIAKEYDFTTTLHRQASYDLLTDLPNRFLFTDFLEKALANCKRTNSKLALLFIDLDHFKPINDSLGHKAGDAVLQSVAHRLTNGIRSSDIVSRYSGDEFVAIIQDISELNSIIQLSEKLIDAINKPYLVDGKKVFCGASIGISVYPDDGTTIETLLSRADQAMYEVKKTSRNNWHFFTESMQIQSEKRHRLYTKLVDALENDKLTVHYQPIVDISNNTISKCESLVRWFDNGEQIPTPEFIELAEETGLINEIDRFVLISSSRFLSKLAATNSAPIGLSINLSPRIFATKDNSLERWLGLVVQASKTLDITIEITERLLVKDTQRVLDVLNTLKSWGVSIAIDDFGTGYSSLSYLTKFPIDILKIDRSFIINLGDDRKSDALTEAVVALSRKLSLTVVAEGVETESQLNYLKQWECHFAQGYYFSKPLDEIAFTKLIESGSTAV
jgi:diguanylate cyclase (GGDEF)-like protein